MSKHYLPVVLRTRAVKIGLNWHLVHGDEFQKIQRVLDKVMQERAAMAQGNVKRLHKRSSIAVRSGNLFSSSEANRWIIVC